MPDARKHRAPNPLDATLFAPDQLPNLRHAVADLSWLLSREYTTTSAIKLVGDRYSLDARQRIAVQRSACSDESKKRRREHRVGPMALRDRPLKIDGYNVLTSVEAALAGGVILIGRDEAFRDLASMHGTWRKVEETTTALQLIGQVMALLRVAHTTWYLDSPVSNSGRLKQLVQAIAAQHHWDWSIELVPDPDKILLQSPDIVATSDSVILDSCRSWFGLAEQVILTSVAQAWVVDLR